MNTPAVSPIGGRLCQRKVSGGHLWVGALHLPDDFVPEEGVAYAMTRQGDELLISPEKLSGPLDGMRSSYGIGDLLTSPIWHKTVDPDTLSARFMSGLPEDNIWVVYGPSTHQLDPDVPSHVWADVSPTGRVRAIEPPFDAAGMAVGQILNNKAVWPGKQGQMYTFPSISSATRERYATLHSLLAQVGREPGRREEVQQAIRANPHLEWLGVGSIDQDYCKFLAALDDLGHMELDRPRTQAEHEIHQDAARRAIAISMGLDDEPAPSTSRRRLGP